MLRSSVSSARTCRHKTALNCLIWIAQVGLIPARSGGASRAGCEFHSTRGASKAAAQMALNVLRLSFRITPRATSEQCLFTQARP
jgi:hypothetical protein